MKVATTSKNLHGRYVKILKDVAATIKELADGIVALAYLPGEAARPEVARPERGGSDTLFEERVRTLEEKLRLSKKETRIASRYRKTREMLDAAYAKGFSLVGASRKEMANCRTQAGGPALVPQATAAMTSPPKTDSRGVQTEGGRMSPLGKTPFWTSRRRGASVYWRTKS